MHCQGQTASLDEAFSWPKGRFEIDLKKIKIKNFTQILAKKARHKSFPEGKLTWTLALPTFSSPGACLHSEQSLVTSLKGRRTQCPNRAQVLKRSKCLLAWPFSLLFVHFTHMN